MGFFIIIFVVFFIFIVVNIIRTQIKNNNSPVVSTNAQITKKWYNQSIGNQNNHTFHDYTYYLLFTLDTGSEITFSVSSSIHNNAYLHEWGKLTFQGTRFLKFESENNNLN